MLLVDVHNFVAQYFEHGATDIEIAGNEIPFLTEMCPTITWGGTQIGDGIFYFTAPPVIGQMG